MNPFRSFRDYERYIYSIEQTFACVRTSNVIVIRKGRRMAIVRGSVTFDKGYRLEIRERLTFDADAVVIESYGYEIHHNNEKIALYDSQPHPHVPELASSHPHHKHIPPDIKHNRVPAPHMGFCKPNMEALIREVESLIA